MVTYLYEFHKIQPWNKSIYFFPFLFLINNPPIYQFCWLFCVCVCVCVCGCVVRGCVWCVGGGVWVCLCVFYLLSRLLTADNTLTYTLRKIYQREHDRQLSQILPSTVFSLKKIKKGSLNCVKFLDYRPMLCKISELDIW